MPLKVSIIIPSFNQGKYIEETIQSVLDQKDQDSELIIIDGGSTDQTVELIQKYEDSIAYWISEPDKGQSEAINKGFKKASGQIITWLGSDDLLMPESIEMVRKTFNALPQKIGVIYGSSEMFGSKTKSRIDKGATIETLERRLAGMAFPQPSSFIRKDFLDDVGELNLSLHYGMDYDLFARLSMVCEFKKMDYCFSRYRIHSDSKSGGDFDHFTQDWIRVFNSIAQGLSLEDSIEVLMELKLFTKPLPETSSFFQKHRIEREVDSELVTFFFIANIFLLSYLSGRFSRARDLSMYLKEHFSDKNVLVPELQLILNRAGTYPPVLLGLARKVKNILCSA